MLSYIINDVSRLGGYKNRMKATRTAYLCGFFNGAGNGARTRDLLMSCERRSATLLSTSFIVLPHISFLLAVYQDGYYRRISAV